MRVGRCSADGDAGEGGHAEVDGRGASGDVAVELGEFGVRCDVNWGDGLGRFAWSDNDAVSSVMNTGTNSGGGDVVEFYVDANCSEAHGYSYLQRSEISVDGTSARAVEGVVSRSARS